MTEILDVKQPLVFDESVSHYEMHSHLPYATSTFNNNDEIHIAIQHQDQCLLPSRSYLHVQGKVLQNDGKTKFTGTLVNNAICHLFSEIRYEINAIEIDKCKNVGLTSIMKAYPSLSPNQLKFLEISGWKNENILDDNGNFDVLLPLSMLLGFAEDYQKIIINAKHELIITRSNVDSNAIFQTDDKTHQFTLTKIEWLMPNVILSNSRKANLLKFIEKDPSITMSFRSWELYEYPQLPRSSRHVWTVKTSNQLEKPRYVILGFQTDRTNKDTANASEFDHCDVTNIKLFLNSQYYPYGNMNLNWNLNQYALLYEMFANFQPSYYNKEHREPILNMTEFKSIAPLIVFDCSKQNETLKYAPVDVRLEFEAKKNFPDKTSAFCLLLHDRIIQYKPVSGDVKKMI